MEAATRARLFNALTEYDRKESRKQSYNPYALAHYARALQMIAAYVDAGHDLRSAIATCTLGRLADCLLRTVGLPILSKEEHKWGFPDKLPYMAFETAD